MKKIFLGLNLIGSLVFAEQAKTKIICYQVVHEALKLEIENLEDFGIDGSFWHRNYAVKVLTLHGPRLVGQEIFAEMNSSPILTRVVYGTGYHINLKNGAVISLEDITFTYWGSKFPVAFTGTIEDQFGHKIDLKCEYGSVEKF